MPPLLGAALIVLLEAFCFTATLPIISYYTQELGGYTAASTQDTSGYGLWIGVMFALMAGPKVITNIFWGKLSDRFGRRPILAINTLGTLVASIGWALAPDVTWLAASRLMIGLFGSQAALAAAVVADSSTPEKRSSGIAVIGAAFAVALTIGPLTAGWLTQYVGYASLGWVLAALQGLSFVVIVFLLPETLPKRSAEAAADARSSAIPPRRTLLRRGDVLQVLLIVMVMTTGLSELNSTYGLVTEHTYGFSALHTSYAFAFFGLLAVLVQGVIVRRLAPAIGERKTSLVGIGFAAAGYGLLAFTPPVAGLWLATALMAIGVALTIPCLTGLLSRMVEPEKQGAIMGLNQSVTGLGRAIGAALGGWLYETIKPHGPTGPYGSAAVLIVVALLMLIPLREPQTRDATGA